MTANIHTLNGLAPATPYSCSVFATNLYGSGPPANISAMTADGGMYKYLSLSGTCDGSNTMAGYHLLLMTSEIYR